MAIIKIDGFDLYTYTRVTPGEGMDIADTDFLEPNFGDSPVGTGDPLLSVNVTNRELTIPVHLRSSDRTKDKLHLLISDLNRRLSVAKVLEWRDDGASASTFLKLEFGRFEPEFNKRRQDAGWMSGVVRLFTRPYGTPVTHGTYNVSSGPFVATGVVASIGIPSYLSDGPLQLKFTINTPTVWNGGEGRIVGAAAVPSGYVVDWSAASIVSLTSSGLVIGVTTAAGSQVLRDINQQNTPFGQIILTNASAYAGRNRVMLVARTDTIDGVFGLIDDNGNYNYNSGGVPSIYYPGEYGTVDLGIVNVDPTSGSTKVITFFLSESRRGNIDGQPFRDTNSFGGVGTNNFYDVNRLILLPEDNTTLVVDTNRRPLSRWMAIPSMTPGIGPIIDDYGNPIAPITDYTLTGRFPGVAGYASSLLYKGSGYLQATQNMICANVVTTPTAVDISGELLMFNSIGNASTIAWVGRVNAGQPSAGYPIVARVGGVNASLSALSIVAGAFSGTAPILLASVGFVSSVITSTLGAQLRFFQRGNAITAKVHYHGQGVGFAASVVATFPIASGHLQGGQGVYGLVMGNSGGYRIYSYDFSTIASIGLTGSDVYTIDGANLLTKRNSVNISNAMRSGYITPPPTNGKTDALIGFVLPLDTSPTILPWSMTVSYNETFTYAI